MFDLISTIDYSSTYWKEPTALVNWCEPDYVHTRYIAETYNTLSNLYTIGFGMLLLRHYIDNQVEKRFKFAALLMIIVGVGSLMFHGTLLYHFQLLDELPMLYLTCCMTYLTLEAFSDKKKYKYPFVPVLLLCVSILMSIAHVTIQSPELFFLVFASLLAPAVVFPFMNRTNKKFNRTMKKSCFCLVVAYIGWELDKSFCKNVQSFHLHSVWHLLTAISGQFWVNSMMYLRCKSLGRPVKLRYGGAWVSFPTEKPLKPVKYTL